MMLLEFSMFPLGKGESVSKYVAQSLEIIDRSGLDYQLHAMGTTLEGEVDDLLTVLKECFEAMSAECDRVECTAKFDFRRGTSGRLHAKIKSVEEKVGKSLKTV
jgi:uncharacterized protein (TIGR00106 family)